MLVNSKVHIISMLGLRYQPDFQYALNLDWELPEGWYFDGCSAQSIMTYGGHFRTVEFRQPVGEFKRTFENVPLKLTFADRNDPTCLMIPFQCKGMAAVNGGKTLQEFWNTKNRITARLETLTTAGH